MSDDTAKECRVCKKKDSEETKLLRCDACKPLVDIWYCGRDCQKADWKKHKKECFSQGFTSTTVNMAPGPSTSEASSTNTSTNTNWTNGKGLKEKVAKPFHRLNEKKWLHDRPESDTYKLLIDTFRMKLEDDYKFEGDAAVGSIYAGEPTSLPAFRKFLTRIETRKKSLLPPWWTKEKRRACERVGGDNSDGNWSDLGACIEKHDVVDHYDDPLMPMQLRMLGEQITGRGPMGQSGEQMVKMQMLSEKHSNN